MFLTSIIPWIERTIKSVSNNWKLDSLRKKSEKIILDLAEKSNKSMHSLLWSVISWTKRFLNEVTDTFIDTSRCKKTEKYIDNIKEKNWSSIHGRHISDVTTIWWITYVKVRDRIWQILANRNASTSNLHKYIATPNRLKRDLMPCLAWNNWLNYWLSSRVSGISNVLIPVANEIKETSSIRQIKREISNNIHQTRPTTYKKWIWNSVFLPKSQDNLRLEKNYGRAFSVVV